MVCQAASQTRFRALKHENGIDGSATIIVGVIACLQPIQDCQVLASEGMEKEFGSWFLHQQSDQLLPNLNALSATFGQQNTNPAYMAYCANVVSTKGTSRGFPFFGIHHSKACQPKEPRGWFDCLPCFQQAFSPLLNNIFKEKIQASPCENHEDVGTFDKAFGHAQKGFVVFDQSGDQTTLVFSSGVGTPVQCLTSWAPNLNNACDLNNTEVVRTGRDTMHCPGPILTNECNENDRDDAGSEMHEDTEELNALLYSDDEDDCYEDDDASTGHSPSTMTAYGKQEWFGKIVEEVASSAGATKRMKLSNGDYNVLLLMDTATSVEPKRCFDSEDDTGSSCADGRNKDVGGPFPLSGNKRFREDNLRETVSVLENIIPRGKGKDASVILDEAIDYLRLLKHKAEALGVGTI